MTARRCGTWFAVVLVLATPVVVAQPAKPGPVPSPRSLSGKAVPDDSVGDGVVLVRLSYDDFGDARPPAGETVSLVAYAKNETVAVLAAKTDARGVARFTGLDRSGGTAYTALANLARGGKIDRLVATPLVLDAKGGARVLLSAEKRTSKVGAVDDANVTAGKPGPVVPKGRVRVAFTGISDVATRVEIVDATTGKVLASAPRAERQKTVAVPVPAGRIVYARAQLTLPTKTATPTTYRSQPVATIADRGAPLAISAYPRMLVRSEIDARLEGRMLAVRERITIDNFSWTPYLPAGGIDVPLPRGFQGAVLADATAPFAVLTRTGLGVTRPLPPGGRTLVVGYALREEAAGTIAWSRELPHGLFQSSMAVLEDPLLTIETPKGVDRSTVQSGGRSYTMFRNISIQPGQSMQFAIKLGTLPPREAATYAACAELRPSQNTVHLRKRVPALVGTQVDGKAFTLASVRGKIMVVNFSGSWVAAKAENERAKLAGLGRALGDKASVVLVANDRQADVGDTQAHGRALRILVDPPRAAGTDNVGALTRAWGIERLPETFLVDRKGIVRFHFEYVREWDSAQAIACVKALAAE